MENKLLVVEIMIPQSLEREELCALLWNEAIEGIEEHDTYILVYILNEDVLKKCEPILEKYPYQIKKIASENWNEIWEKNYHDIYIENLLHIRAPHHSIDKSACIEITIQPKMSFGTGHHSTTYLMAKNMFDISFAHQSVLDIGTGTGILAILAEKLKSTNIMAIDNDPICIENTHENILLNDCKHIVVKHSSDMEYKHTFNIILANIHQHYLQENVELLYSLLAPKGLLLVSGFLEENIDHIKVVFSKCFLCIKEEIKESNEHWAFLMFEKKEI